MDAKDRSSPFAAALAQAAALIQRGSTVAFPTETFYGLAVDPFHRSAVARLFRLKQRPANKPILLLINDLAQLPLLTESIPPMYQSLIDRYWPGPLTLIFPAKKSLPLELTGGTGTVGVRISSHPLAQSLVEMVGAPITATSANLSGFPPAQSADEVASMFGASLDYVLDGGVTPGGLSSTIVGMSGTTLKTLRDGAIHLELSSNCRQAPDSGRQKEWIRG